MFSTRTNYQTSLLLLFCLLAMWQTGSAQDKKTICGFDHIHQTQMAKDAEYKRIVEANEVAIQAYMKSGKGGRTEGTVYKIPCVVHIIHTGGAIGTTYNPTDATITTMISNMTKAFRNQAPYNPAAGNDVEIEFELAKRSPTCTATNAINRIDINATALSGADKTKYIAEGIKSNSSANPLGVVESIIKPVSIWSNTDYYNIWIVNRIEGADGTSGTFTAGYAYFPGAGADVDGTVMLATQTADVETITHELRHGFNLYHTFEGSSGVGVCPPNATCLTQGDRVCDTDPQDNNPFQCTTNACGATTVLPNYMSYSNCATRNYTAGQSTRMRAALETTRSGLISSQALVAPIGSVTVACTPTNTGLSMGRGVTLFKFNTLNISSGHSIEDNTNYIDRSCLQQTTVSAGAVVPVQIATSVNACTAKVFIDFNNNGVFTDSGEEVFTGTSTSTGVGVPPVFDISGNINIPATGITFNTALRMRVVAAGNSPATPTSCSVNTGQAEDYGVIVTASATPTITTTGTLAAFSSCAGSVSANQSYTVSGANLTANLVITSPNANFEISLSAGSGFGSSLTLTPASGTVNSTTIFVRQTAGAANAASGDITHTSTGANNPNVAILVSTVNPLPTISLGTIANVTTAATTFTIPYTATTGTPNQYSITTGGATPMPSFVAVSNATLPATPITVTIPASAANTYNFTLTVRNSTTGCVSATIPFTLTTTVVICGTITVFPTILADGVNGETYSRTLSQTGGSGAITYSVSAGGLPTGLTLNASTGVLSGTPTANGTYNFTITATDGNACTGNRSYTVTIATANASPTCFTSASTNGLARNPITGNIWVTDRFNASGFYLYELNPNGTNVLNKFTGTFGEALGIAFSGNLVYVADRTGNKIQILNTLTGTWSDFAASPAVNSPCTILVEGNNLYVLERASAVATSLFRIYDITTGNQTTSFGMSASTNVGTNNIRFNLPHSFIRDAVGNLFITDHVLSSGSISNGRLLVVNAAGTLTNICSYFGATGITLDSQDRIWVLNTPASTSSSNYRTNILAGNCCTLQTMNTGNVRIIPNTTSTSLLSATNSSCLNNNNIPALGNLNIATTQNISGMHNNVTINSGGVATLTCDLYVQGTLTIQNGGRLNTNCFNVIGTGNFDLQSGGTFAICNPQGIAASGTTGAIQVTGTRNYDGNATYIFNGTAAQITGNALPATVANVEINNAANVTLSQATSISRLLTMTAGNLLAGNNLTIAATTTQQAMVINNGTSTVTGNVNVQRYLRANTGTAGLGYRFVSSPTSNATLNELSELSPVVNPAFNGAAFPGRTSPFPTVYSYNPALAGDPAKTFLTSPFPEFDKGWVSPNALTDAMTVGRGFTVNTNANQVAEITGLLNNGNVTIPIATGNAASLGYNLVGNPYPSPISWAAVRGLSTGVQDAIYQNMATGQYSGSWASFVGGVGVNGATDDIAVMQGFFVIANAAGNVNFANSVRATSYKNPSSFRTEDTQNGTANKGLVRLAMTNSANKTDETVVYFKDEATQTFDSQHDAYKFQLNGGNFSNIYTTDKVANTNEKATLYAINALPTLTDDLIVPVTLQAWTDGEQKIAMTEKLNFTREVKVFLKDKTTNTLHDFSTGAYTVNLPKGVTAGRYELVFQPQFTTEELSKGIVNVYPNPTENQLTFSLSDDYKGLVTIKLTDVAGREVWTNSLQKDKTTLQTAINLVNLPTGLYVLTAQGKKVVSQKVVKQ